MKRLHLCLYPLLSLALILSSENLLTKKVEDLPPSHRKWLTEEVVYIITQKEREAFLKLETNQERDLFIEAFWKQRDPTPESPENEFKEEHYRRLEYANKNFGKGTSKPGWKTDRGRIYIILGKPNTVERYGSLEHNLVPIEVWFYQGHSGAGLPASFYVVFFQEWGIGDYILYSPLRHGPRKLIETYDVDPNKAMSILNMVNPELAKVARSLIPTQSPELEAGSPLASEALLNKISSLPQEKIKEEYAEKLLKYKALIEVDHSVNYIENDALVKIIRDEGGFFLVHYGLEPKRLSIGKKEKKFFVRLEIYGKISDTAGKNIYQFQKEVLLNFDEEQVEEMRRKLFSFQDLFPLIPGDFKFDLLLKNPVSGEFTSLEKEISVPKAFSFPSISSLILSSRVNNPPKEEKTYKPFRFKGIQILPTATRVFTSKDKLYVYLEIYGLDEELKNNGSVDFSISKEDKIIHNLKKRIRDLENPESFIQEFSLSSYSPGRYLLKVSLLGRDETEITSEREDFTISPLVTLPEYWSLSEIYPPSGDPYYAHILGSQMLNAGEIEKAVALLELAYSMKPASLEYGLALANAYLARENYQRVQEILSRFLEKAKEEPQIYYMLGIACQKRGEFGRAVYYYKKYLLNFGTHLGILNALGECHFQEGNLKEALDAWEKSLELDPKQEELKERVSQLKKKEEKKNI